MIDIKSLPMAELLTDRAESVADMDACARALTAGIVSYGRGESVQERLRINKEIVAKIDAELKRRTSIVHGHQHFRGPAE